MYDDIYLLVRQIKQTNLKANSIFYVWLMKRQKSSSYFTVFIVNSKITVYNKWIDVNPSLEFKYEILHFPQYWTVLVLNCECQHSHKILYVNRCSSSECVVTEDPHSYTVIQFSLSLSLAHSPCVCVCAQVKQFPED